MTDGAEGVGDVAGERADIGALGDVGGEGDFVQRVTPAKAGA
jgi:hypothetical protein